MRTRDGSRDASSATASGGSASTTGSPSRNSDLGACAGCERRLPVKRAGGRDWCVDCFPTVTVDRASPVPVLKDQTRQGPSTPVTLAPPLSSGRSAPKRITKRELVGEFPLGAPIGMGFPDSIGAGFDDEDLPG